MRTSALLLLALTVAACSPPTAGAPSPVTPSATATPAPPSGPSPSPAASASPTTCAINPIPGLCVGRGATPAEQSAMLVAGVSAAEADLGVPDGSGCRNGQTCFWVGDPPRTMVGVHAGTFYGSIHGYPEGAGAGCWVYLYEDATGWHFNSVRCAQAPGSTPGLDSNVHVTGCANVRDAPSTSGRVLDCVPGGTRVDVDSAPVYADGHIWWHLARRGWMAHEFLIGPKPAGQTR